MIKPYSYQLEAVERMRGQECMVLADDMGLGKTVTALCEIRITLDGQRPKILVAAPNSAKDVWRTHAIELLPRWPITVVPSGKGEAYRDIAVEAFLREGWGLLIVHWDALRLLPKLQKVKWDFVIADEAHNAKNRKALKTKALKKLPAKYKRALSGTPLVNRPDELWSLLNWLYRREFSSYWRFYEAFCEYDVHPRYGFKMFRRPKNVERLREIIKPLMVRRLKSEVMKDLPEKYYTTMRLEMQEPQERAYREMKSQTLAWVGEHEDEPVKAPTVLAQLTRLRQFACSYAQVDGGVLMSEPSNKLDALLDIVEGTGEKIIVFSQFKQMIRLATQRLIHAGINCYEMTGETSELARQGMIREFQGPEGRQVFLATVQTGGVGITLTAASLCVFLDRTWSPAINLQAEDRLHRIGQKNAVQIILLQSTGTIDIAVEEALEMKWSWIRKIIG